MRDIATLAKKFVTRASAAQPEYKAGVEGAGAEWEKQTVASEAAYEGGVQDAIAKKRFLKGVRNSGAAHYTERASKVGPQRYDQGVRVAESAWQQGFTPVAGVINATLAQLPPRGPRRGPQNTGRSNMMATALGAWKENQ